MQQGKQNIKKYLKEGRRVGELGNWIDKVDGREMMSIHRNTEIHFKCKIFEKEERSEPRMEWMWSQYSNVFRKSVQIQLQFATPFEKIQLSRISALQSKSHCKRKNREVLPSLKSTQLKSQFQTREQLQALCYFSASNCLQMICCIRGCADKRRLKLQFVQGIENIYQPRTSVCNGTNNCIGVS